MDKRWQMVVDCLGAAQPPFRQGTLLNFRMRLITHNLAKTLLERTVDPTPLFGASRVEDPRTLLGHAPLYQRHPAIHAVA
jgi:hypothetical protein